MPTRPHSNEIVRRGEELVYSNRYVSVYYDSVTFPGGVEGNYTRVVVGAHRGVAVLPVRDGHIGLVRQYRYPLGRSMWEAPRGFAESDDAEANASRELGEETGVAPVEMVNLGVLHPDSGTLASEVVLFLARVSNDAPFRAVDEVDDAMWVSVPEALDMVADGEITDAYTVALVCRSHLRGLF